MKNIVQSNAYASFGGPHHWNDPDLLVVGNIVLRKEDQDTRHEEPHKELYEPD